MNDPRPLYRQLTSGTVGPGPAGTLLATRQAIRAGAADLDGVRTAVRGAWTGLGADGATRCFDQRSAALSAADAELSAAVNLLTELAAEQDRVKRAATPLIQWWSRSYVLFFFANPVLLELISAQVCTALARLRHTHRAELERIAASFDRLSGDAQGAAPVGADTAHLPSPGTSPQAVADWWRALSPAQQAALQAQHPDELAELDGLPPTVLDGVNRARVARDRTTAQAQVDKANEGLRERGLVGLPDAELLSNSDPEVRRLAREHAAAQNALEHADQTDAAVRDAQTRATAEPPIGPVLLLAYRNTGAGGLAIAFGDPSKAHDVAVAVPGTYAGPQSPSLEQASALRREMDHRDPSGSHATVEWVDYDAPDSIVGTQVISAAQAHEGSARLVGDVAGWRAAAGTQQHVTVIGHSYGSTLVGFAGQQGLAADDIAVVGSPGVGASSAGGLSAGRGHVWAGSAEHDPVVQATQGSWFTENGSGVGPYDKAFGAHQFDTTSAANTADAHSTYYDGGSPSLRNLAAISTGDFAAVTGANANEVATANPARQLAEGAGDAIRGAGRTVVDALTGHPEAALQHAASTAMEARSDALDFQINNSGEVAARVANVYKATLGRFL